MPQTIKQPEIRNVSLRLEHRFDKMQRMIDDKADRILERLSEQGDRTHRGQRREAVQH